MAGITEKKQNYLFDEIVQQGYDAEAFMNFMAESKEDGTNIDKWNMTELINIVSDYKIAYAQNGMSLKRLEDNFQSTSSIKSDSAALSSRSTNQQQPQQQYPPQGQVESAANRNQPNLQQQSQRQGQAQQTQQLQRPPQSQQQGNQQQRQNPNLNQSSINQPKQQQSRGGQDDDDDDPFASILKKTSNSSQGQSTTTPSKPSFGLGGEKPKNNFKDDKSDPWTSSAATLLSQSQIMAQQPQFYSQQQQVQQYNDPFAQFAASSTSGHNNKGNPNQGDPFDSFYSSSQPKASEQQKQQSSKAAAFDLDSLLVDTVEPAGQQNKNKQQMGNLDKAATGNAAASRSTGGLSLAAASVGSARTANSSTNAQNNEKRRKSIEIDKNNENALNTSGSLSSRSAIPTDNAFMFEKECRLSVSTVVGVRGDVNVLINDHSVLTGSLFSVGSSSSIVMYAVNTQPFNWIVKRKYQDFLWLRNILVKIFPTISIPPLPKNTSLSEKLISRRKAYFESFLNELLSYPDIKSSKQITDFLSIGDEKMFKAKVKESEKTPYPKNISEIETVTGKINLNRNPQCNAHSTSFQEFLDVNDKEYEKLKKLQKQLVEAYGAVGNVLHQIGDTFAQLNLNTVTFNKKAVPSAQVKELEDTYVMLNNMFVQQANRFTSEIKLFQTHFYDFFKYHKDNFIGFKPILKTRNELASALQKKDANESSGLSSLFRSSSGSYVYSPQKTLKDLEEQVAYYNECVVEGSKKLLENRSIVFSKHFIEYCEIHKSINEKMGSVWQDIADNFQNILLKQPVTKTLMTAKKAQPTVKSKEAA